MKSNRTMVYGVNACSLYFRQSIFEGLWVRLNRIVHSYTPDEQINRRGVHYAWMKLGLAATAGARACVKK